MPSAPRRAGAPRPSPTPRGGLSVSAKSKLTKSKRRVSFATNGFGKRQQVSPETPGVNPSKKGSELTNTNVDQRDKSRRGVKRSSTTKIKSSPAKKPTPQKKNNNSVKTTIKAASKIKAVKIIPKKGTKVGLKKINKGSLKKNIKTRPSKNAKASPKKIIKTSPKKTKKLSSKKASPARKTPKTKVKGQGSSSKHTKPKNKTVAQVKATKLNKLATSKTKKATTTKVKKPASKTKATSKGKTGAAKSKPRVKKTASKDKKKGAQNGKGGVRTKKGDVAKGPPQKGKRVAKHPNSKLVPNLNIAVVAKDPMFEVKNEKEIPEVSPYVNCKRVIRAVITKDTPLLKRLITSKELPSIFTKRSVDLRQDSMDYAIKMENVDAIKLLLPELKNDRKRKAMPHILMQHQDTGSYNYRSLGHAVRAINLGRGCREGDNAFTKDIEFYNTSCGRYSVGFIENALTLGVSLNTMNELTNQEPSFQMICLQKVYLAVQAGHHKLAGHFVKQANTRGGFGFNTLHQQALLANKPEDLGTFKGVSVIKKTIDNNKITPLHCAAINPNPKILEKLLLFAPNPSCNDHTGNEVIHYAAACTSSGPLQLLLNRGISADQLVPKKLVTPLMLAAMYGRTRNIEVLLKHLKSFSDQEETVSAKKGVDLKDKKGNFAIHYAAEKGHVDAVRCLVKHGAGVETMMSAVLNKLTPLMIASQKGHFELAKALIEEMGAIVEKKDKIKRTALMLACMNGHYPIATLLLRKGADPNAKDSSGNTPIHYAAAYGWWHCLKLLLKAGGDPNILNDWKNPPLGIAYLKGHLGCTDLLLDQPGVNVNFRDDSGSTLLLTTCSHRMDEDTVKQFKYLLQKGADVTVVNINGDNALHKIASVTNENQMHSAPAITKLLMEKGCNPAAKNASGKTPIGIALSKGTTELLKILVSNGDRIPLEADRKGETPLHHMAANCTHKDQSHMIQLIADMEKKDGSTPMDTDDEPGTKFMTLEDAAKLIDNHTCTPFLRCIMVNRKNLSNGNVCNTLQALIKLCKSDINAYKTDFPRVNDRRYALHILAVEQPSTALSMVLECKPKLDVKDLNGDTPLPYAITNKQIENAKTLLSHGADPNASESNSLLIAVRRDLPSVIPDLLAKGADVNGSEFSNKQPSIMHCISTNISNLLARISTARALLEAGASLSSVDNRKRTVLHNAVNLAESSITTEFLELLLDHKPDVFALDDTDKMPLHYAFFKASMFDKFGGQFDMSTSLDPIETVSLLVDVMEGKELNHPDKYGRTPLHYAAFRGAMNSSMYIDERVDDFDSEDINGYTPLAMAVVSGKESMATWLIHKGANLNKMLTLGLEPMSAMYTAKTPASPTTLNKYWLWAPRAMAAKPASVFKKSLFEGVVHNRWQGALYVMMNRIDKFKIAYASAIEAVLADHQYQIGYELVRKQRDPRKLQSTNAKKQNLLHLLAIHADRVSGSEATARIAESLLDHGVKLFAKDHMRCTPLHYAAVNLNANLFSIFAEKAPADFKRCIQLSDQQGRVPLISLFWGLTFNEDLKKIILTIQKFDSSLNVLGYFPDVGVLSQEKRAKADSLEEWYHDLELKTVHETPLIFMIRMNCFEGCKFLLQKGADTNTSGSNGVTPLMHAIMQNETVLVNVMLDYKYDPLTAGWEKTSETDLTSSLWITDIWEQKRLEQKKSSTNDSIASINVDAGYHKDKKVDQDKVPKLHWSTSVWLNALDALNRTAIHCLMKTCDIGTYENVEILERLARIGAKLSEKDAQGRTPLDCAIESGSFKMAEALQKLTNVAPKERVNPEPVSPAWTDGIDFSMPELDVDGDAEAMVEQLEAERSKTRVVKESKPDVDPNSGMVAGGEVLMDTEQNIPYDIIMTKVDVQYSFHGMNNFYRMQIIHQVAKDVHVLFTRWGRIGDIGQFQKTPFGSKEEAIAEFIKIFKAKSGNNWADVDNFQKKPKKYMLVQTDPGRAQRDEALGEFRFNLDSPVPSKLPQCVQDVLFELTKPQTLKESILQTKIDPNIMNFGHLPKDVLLRAKDILDQITKKIEKADSDKENVSSTIDQYQAAMDEVYALSNEYFYLIPQENFAHDVITPLTETSTVCTHKRYLTYLLELEVTNRILLGATFRKQEINPLDYIYLALDCKVKLMDKDDAETQLILQHIHSTCNTTDPPQIEAIFQLSRQGEDERLRSCKLSNHKLLWHGSSTINLMSILKDGLVLSPREAAITGSRFGKGIYTSDTFEKSIAYCNNEYHSLYEKSHFMLLCQVALGKMGGTGHEELNDETFNSTFALGRHFTDSKRELLLPTGASLNIGKLIQLDRWGSYSSGLNEYVARTEEQVCLRYLVQCQST